ncbi:hypothetical protein P4C99_00650 [Pontiellaceae bacterium B1224]|nr:hypothetical protein [Pontiellaceae bacterium B1224]
MRKMRDQKMTGTLALGMMLFGGLSAQAVTYDWTNAEGDNNYLTTNNWAYPGGEVSTNLPSTNGDVVNINLSGDDRVIINSGTPGNINTFAVGSVAGASGELEINGGSAKATANASRYSTVGNGAGVTGLVTINGGTWEVNRSRIGQNGGVGTVVLNDGVFKVARGANGYSIWLDISTGLTEGNLEINGGLLSTRVGMQINDMGTMTVRGGASSIQIGGAGGADQCLFDVNPGATLAVQVATNGLSPIEIDNEHLTLPSSATFDAGSFLEPSFFGGHVETNAWIVMALETSGVDGAAINADELALAPGVDPLWSFGVTNNPVDEVDVLWVGYAGAVYEPPVVPVYTTNLYVEAIQLMAAETWNLYAPLPGNSITNQSGSGFSTTFAANTYTNDRSGFIPVVAQEFFSTVDLSEVGQSVTVSFDIEMLTQPQNADKDFHFGFYDTDLNAQIWTGFDLGTASGSTWVMRMWPWISATDTNNFVPGDYGWLGTSGGSFGSGVQYSGAGLSVNNVMHYESSLVRIATDEVEYTTLGWDYTGNVGSTGSYSHVINESTPQYPENMPASGKWDKVNGFGFTLFENVPFTSDSGTFVVSNLTVTAESKLPQGWSYSISGIAFDSAGDLTLFLSDPIVGATYDVTGTSDLIHVAPSAVGTYVAEEPGVIKVPAADAGVNRFFDVALPVKEVIE